VSLAPICMSRTPPLLCLTERSPDQANLSAYCFGFAYSPNVGQGQDRLKHIGVHAIGAGYLVRSIGRMSCSNKRRVSAGSSLVNFGSHWPGLMSVVGLPGNRVSIMQSSRRMGGRVVAVCIAGLLYHSLLAKPSGMRRINNYTKQKANRTVESLHSPILISSSVNPYRS